MNRAALQKIAALVNAETGMVIKERQLPALAAAVGRVVPGMTPERVLPQLSGGTLLNRLIDEVTVQETYFFRETRDLETIDWKLLLERAQESGSGVVRIWVAACATGEEAYTLAILASEALGPLGTPVAILGTDVSPAALDRAMAGEGYSPRSVRNLPRRLRDRYLLEEDGRYRVRDSLKSLVRFRRHNLIRDPSPPLGEAPYDLIACRNVLIYFDPPTIVKVIGSLEAALRPEGELILGAADRISGTAGALERAGGESSRRGVERRRGRPRSAKPTLRRPLGLEPKPGEADGPAAPARPGGGGGKPRRGEYRVEDALFATDAGDFDGALEIVEALLAKDPLFADAHFVRGLVELDAGDARAAIYSLRRSLYLDPSFGLAAFELGRAHDASGDPRAARRFYAQALRSLDPEDERHSTLLDQVDLADVAAACRTRLQRSGAEAR
jgi:chemotaxis protein methyltransferase CheR